MGSNNVPLRGSAVVDAAGRAVVAFRVRGLARYRFTQISNEMLNPGGTARCTLRFNGALHAPFPNPSADAVAGAPYIVAGVGDEVTVEWTGAAPGAIGNAVAWWDYED